MVKNKDIDSEVALDKALEESFGNIDIDKILCET